MDKDINLRNIYEQHIQGTQPKEYVKVFTFLLCHLQRQIKKSVNAKSYKVYVTSKALKHIYDRHCHDKKQDDVFETIINNLSNIIKNPDIVKENKESKKKKGTVIFIKKIDGENYACPVEICKVKKGKKMVEMICIVSAFKLKNENYLAETSVIYSSKQE